MAQQQFGRRGATTPKIPMRPASEPVLAHEYAGAAHAEPADYSDNSFGGLNYLSGIFNLLFSFQGRVGRLQYWGLGTMVFFIQFSIFMAFVGQASLANSPDAVARELSENSSSIWTLLLALLPGTVSGYSITVRRMHDRDVSGYWIFAWFTPFVGFLICLPQSFANMFFAGTPGPNRFDNAAQTSVFD